MKTNTITLDAQGMLLHRWALQRAVWETQSAVYSADSWEKERHFGLIEALRQWDEAFPRGEDKAKGNWSITAPTELRQEPRKVSSFQSQSEKRRSAAGLANIQKRFRLVQ